MKKKYDPLWEIVGEKVNLQGSASATTIKCPNCHVPLDLPGQVRPGRRFRCGVCGALCEVGREDLVADDRTPKVTAHLAE